MYISSLKLHPIAIADPPLRSSYGLHAPYALRTIVEIETGDGLTGISETYGGDGPPDGPCDAGHLLLAVVTPSPDAALGPDQALGGEKPGRAGARERRRAHLRLGPRPVVSTGISCSSVLLSTWLSVVVTTGRPGP